MDKRLTMIKQREIKDIIERVLFKNLNNNNDLAQLQTEVIQFKV